jgi:IclR family acetate operon transcriptional repressor
MSSTIQSVERAASLLLGVAASPTGQTGTVAAEQAGLAVPTTHHILKTLTNSDLLRQEPDRRFVLGPAVADLSQGWVSHLACSDSWNRPLAELAESTGETAYLATWRGDRIEVAATIEGANAVRVGKADRGTYRDAHARATGKLLLALAPAAQRERYLEQNRLNPVTAETITDRDNFDRELDRIRERGLAEDHEEFAEGVCCISAPGFVRGRPLVAYTLSAPRERFFRKRPEYEVAVMRAAGEATVELEHHRDRGESL